MSYLANKIRPMLAAVIAVSGVAMLGVAADAAPLSIANGAINQSVDSVTPVRDGCGYGMRYSYRAGGCVPEGYGPPPAYGYGPPPPPAYVDPGAAIVGGIVNGIIGATPGCPPGTRWSNRRGACVYY